MESNPSAGMEVNPAGYFNAKGNYAERQNIQRGRNGAFWQVMRKECEAKQHRIEQSNTQGIKARSQY